MSEIDGWDGLIHPAASKFPLIVGDEFDALVDSISREGLLEPCWVSRSGVLLDGRNRIRACQKAGVRPAFRTYEGDDELGFVITENLRRRHLTDGQRAMLALEFEPMLAEQARLRRIEAGRTTGRGQGGKVGATRRQPIAREPKSAERAGKALNVSGRSVARAKRVKAKAPDLAEKVEAGELELGRAERVVRDREAEERRVAEAAQAREQAPEKYRIDIRHGDFREVLADLADVDAIITDPPYPREFLPLLGDLAAWADQVLAPDGVLVVLLGQTHLPDAYALMSGWRPYRWTGCYLTPGGGYVSHPRSVQSNWKPLLVYGGGPRFADVVRSTGTDASAKDLHHWGQDYHAFHQIVERLTKPGQTVVDPFLGSGTTLLAANALGRHAVGCDIDPEHVETARRRLA